jgi:hypothetical protein
MRESLVGYTKLRMYGCVPPAFQAPNRILKFNSSCVIPVESFLTHMHVTHPSPFLLLLAAWRRKRAAARQRARQRPRSVAGAAQATRTAPPGADRRGRQPEHAEQAGHAARAHLGFGRTLASDIQVPGT